jgi:hypothetical protein
METQSSRKRVLAGAWNALAPRGIVSWAAWAYAVWTVLAVGYFLLDGSIALGPKLKLDPSQIKEVSGKGYRFKPTTAQAKKISSWENGHLYENGKEMLPQVGSAELVIKEGGGACHFSQKNIWLSTQDGSDPRTNQRHYDLALPLTLPSAPIWLLRLWSWGLIILGLVAARHRIAAGGKMLVSSPLGKLAILVVLLRVVLISHDEIVATVSDEQEYMVLAKSWYYHAVPELYFRLPVYPLFVALTSTTGLPLRLVIELVQIASYALLAAALRRCGFSRWAVFAVFAWMTLSHESAGWNNYSITETLYLAVTFAALALGLLWLCDGRWKQGLGCGLLLALLLNLREERIIGVAMGGLLLASVALKMWLASRKGSLGKGSVSKGLLAVSLGLAPMVVPWVVVDGVFQAAFYLRTGVSAHCLLSTPGMLDFMDAMYRIPTQGPSRPFYWLDKKVRDYAGSLSPTFRSWEPNFENETIGFHDRAERVTGVRDLPADAVVFTIMWNGIPSHGLPMKAREREDTLKQIAAEIRQGLAGHEQQSIYMRGTYTVNSAVLAMWLRDIRPLLLKSLQWSFYPLMNGPYPRVGPTSDDVVALFDSLIHRRPSLAKIMDSSGDPRPPWIKSAWALMAKIEAGCLWLALALALLLPTAALFRREGRERVRDNLTIPVMAAVLLLLLIALARIALGTLVPLYFIDEFPRYMTTVPLVSLPILVLLIDIASRRTQSDLTPQS